MMFLTHSLRLAVEGYQEYLNTYPLQLICIGEYWIMLSGSM